MRFVMLREEHVALVVQRLANSVGDEHLLVHPDRDGGEERLEPLRREPQVRLDQAIEFQERFFVEADAVELGDVDATLGEAEGDGS